jgi:hypothetical protein
MDSRLELTPLDPRQSSKGWTKGEITDLKDLIKSDNGLRITNIPINREVVLGVLGGVLVS